MRQLRKLRTLRKVGAPAPTTRPPSDRRYGQGRRTVARRSLKDCPPPTPLSTPCRLAQGGLDKYGYGAKKVYDAEGVRRSVKLHRWVVEQGLGRALEPWETVLHLCDNPPCYRFDHLRVGTVAENNADARQKGRAKPPPINRLYGEANPNSRAAREARLRSELPERTTDV